MTKPVLGLILGGTLGLMDGLSGFLEPSLVSGMASVIAFSMLKGLVAGIAIGYLSQRFGRWRGASSRASRLRPCLACWW